MIAMTANPKDQCLTDLRRRILSTELAPGTPLDEAGLTKTYKISRTPLREVLQRLAGAGYVQIEDNRGAKVASMDIAVLRTFFQTAPLIYANISRLAAEHRTAAQIDDLKAAQQGFTVANAAGDADAAALANHRFHEVIGDMAQNPYLMACLSRMLIDHTRLSQTFYRPETRQEAALVQTAQDQHDMLIAAIEARDTSRATDLTLQHWDLSKDRMERFVRPDPLPLDLDALEREAHAV